MHAAAVEDRATRGRDPSADCGAKTQGWAALRRPSLALALEDWHKRDKTIGDAVAESGKTNRGHRGLLTPKTANSISG